MVVRTRIEILDRDIDLIFATTLSPQERSAELARHAKAALAEAQTINAGALGMVPPHETFVDGRRGAAVESVKPDGVVVFEFELLSDLFAWIGEQLVLHAPVLTGAYRRSFRFFSDGLEVEPGSAVPNAREYMFLNVQPYARKIERGLSDQAPDGVFQAVAVLAKARFGNLAMIRFSYRSPGPAAMRVKGSQKAERSSRVPAIVIVPR